MNKNFHVATAEMELILKSFDTGTKEKHNFFYNATDVISIRHKKPTACGRNLKVPQPVGQMTQSE